MSHGPDLRWRLRWAAFGAVTALLLVAATLLLANLVRSPQDVLAEESAPPPSRITAPVERRALDSSVVVVGTLNAATSVTGQLPVGDRAAAQQAKQVIVVLPSGRVAGDLGKVAADGRFTIRLSEPVTDARGTTATVRFTSPDQAGPVLVVPISALFTAADGHTAVVLVDEGRERQARVTMGAQAGGFAEITPAGRDQVHEGDLVLVSEPRS